MTTKAEKLYDRMLKKLIKADKYGQVEDLMITLEELELNYCIDDFPHKCNDIYCPGHEYQMVADLRQAADLICPEVLKK